MGSNEEYLKNLITNSRIAYNKIVRIYCPCLDANIFFNAQGFHHMSYDGGGTPRTTKEKIYKLKLLPRAIPVIKYATSVNEYRKQKQDQKQIEYWSLVSSVGKNRDIKVKVIHKRVGNCNIIFWSVMRA